LPPFKTFFARPPSFNKEKRPEEQQKGYITCKEILAVKASKFWIQRLAAGRGGHGHHHAGVHKGLCADHTSYPLRWLWEAIFGAISNARWEIIHFLIRKSGHFLGYGFIGVAWLRAWWMTLPPLPFSRGRFSCADGDDSHSYRGWGGNNIFVDRPLQ